MQSVRPRDAFAYSALVLAYIAFIADTVNEGNIFEDKERLAIFMAITTASLGGYAIFFYSMIFFSRFVTGLDAEFAFWVMAPDWITPSIVRIAACAFLFAPLISVNPLAKMDDPVPEENDKEDPHKKWTDEQVTQFYVAEILKDNVSKKQILGIIIALMRIVDFQKETAKAKEEEEGEEEDTKKTN